MPFAPASNLNPKSGKNLSYKRILSLKSKKKIRTKDCINQFKFDMEAYSPTHMVVKQWKGRKNLLNLMKKNL